MLCVQYVIRSYKLSLAYSLSEGKELNRGANKASDARLDVRCHGFWERQRAAFFDIRPNADSYKEFTPKQIYQLHENEKKRKYGSRVTEVGQGTFTPLVFITIIIIIITFRIGLLNENTHDSLQL